MGLPEKILIKQHGPFYQLAPFLRAVFLLQSQEDIVFYSFTFRTSFHKTTLMNVAFSLFNDKLFLVTLKKRYSALG